MALATWAVLLAVAAWTGTEWVERQRLDRRIRALEVEQAELLRQVEAATGTEAEVAVTRATALVDLASSALDEAEEAVAEAAEAGRRARTP